MKSSRESPSFRAEQYVKTEEIESKMTDKDWEDIKNSEGDTPEPLNR